MTSHLDDERRADLLCYLVIAQLIGRARTGNWLRTDHLVESKRIWERANDISVLWFEGARLGEASVQLAASVWAIDLLHDVDNLAKLLTDAWQVNYESPIARGIYEICASRLMTWRFEL
ncbi:conserved hypothetical protein [Paraburkholderia sabiae]|uniref:hypothetical protein n=1 Tax=Paraburkholderia sabiae TaxID=273251 RepID=UPI001CAB0F1F|nr:hypothetical protein [Paraburkholderia sabiae]CAG9229829.1 conserved hypothetical protein [Paraburkholderia sabiae]